MRADVAVSALRKMIRHGKESLAVELLIDIVSGPLCALGNDDVVDKDDASDQERLKNRTHRERLKSRITHDVQRLVIIAAEDVMVLGHLGGVFAKVQQTIAALHAAIDSCEGSMTIDDALKAIMPAVAVAKALAETKHKGRRMANIATMSPLPAYRLSDIMEIPDAVTSNMREAAGLPPCNPSGDKTFEQIVDAAIAVSKLDTALEREEALLTTVFDELGELLIKPDKTRRGRKTCEALEGWLDTLVAKTPPSFQVAMRAYGTLYRHTRSREAFLFLYLPLMWLADPSIADASKKGDALTVSILQYEDQTALKEAAVQHLKYVSTPDVDGGPVADGHTRTEKKRGATKRSNDFAGAGVVVLDPETQRPIVPAWKRLARASAGLGNFPSIHADGDDGRGVADMVEWLDSNVDANGFLLPPSDESKDGKRPHATAPPSKKRRRRHHDGGAGAGAGAGAGVRMNVVISIDSDSDTDGTADTMPYAAAAPVSIKLQEASLGDTVPTDDVCSLPMKWMDSMFLDYSDAELGRWVSREVTTIVNRAALGTVPYTSERVHYVAAKRSQAASKPIVWLGEDLALKGPFATPPDMHFYAILAEIEANEKKLHDTGARNVSDVSDLYIPCRLVTIVRGEEHEYWLASPRVGAGPKTVSLEAVYDFKPVGDVAGFYAAFPDGLESEHSKRVVWWQGSSAGMPLDDLASPDIGFLATIAKEGDRPRGEDKMRLMRMISSCLLRTVIGAGHGKPQNSLCGRAISIRTEQTKDVAKMTCLVDFLHSRKAFARKGLMAPIIYCLEKGRANITTWLEGLTRVVPAECKTTLAVMIDAFKGDMPIEDPADSE